jgi:putative PIN family toxin of toxin-antitoxin system
MKVVIDTNVLIIAIPKISKYRPIFDSLLSAKFTIAISESILQEYIEIIGKKSTASIAQNLGELLTSLENVEKAEVYYHWRLIQFDPDDNKFVDCAISSGVDYLVSNDNHFNELKSIPFPPIEVINADIFLKLLRDME